MTTAKVFQRDRGVVAVRSLVWIAVLTLAAAQARASGAPAPTAKPEAAETKEKSEKVEPIPDDIQLIAALDPEMKGALARWGRSLAMWPPADEIKRKKATEDRSEKTEEKRPVAVTPQDALKEAEFWIKTIVKPGWIPSDLNARLYALAEKDLTRSAVWCRYKIKGQAIQIGQMRGIMCVVIQPDKPKGKDETPQDFGRRCLKEFLASGELLAQSTKNAVPLTSPGLTMFSGHFETHDASNEWGGPVTWYTDGQALAVVLKKRMGQVNIGADTPWF